MARDIPKRPTRSGVIVARSGVTAETPRIIQDNVKEALLVPNREQSPENEFELDREDILEDRNSYANESDGSIQEHLNTDNQAEEENQQSLEEPVILETDGQPGNPAGIQERAIVELRNDEDLSIGTARELPVPEVYEHQDDDEGDHEMQHVFHERRNDTDEWQDISQEKQQLFPETQDMQQKSVDCSEDSIHGSYESSDYRLHHDGPETRQEPDDESLIIVPESQPSEDTPPVHAQEIEIPDVHHTSPSSILAEPLEDSQLKYLSEVERINQEYEDARDDIEAGPMETAQMKEIQEFYQDKFTVLQQEPLEKYIESSKQFPERFAVTNISDEQPFRPQPNMGEIASDDEEISDVASSIARYPIEIGSLVQPSGAELEKTAKKDNEYTHISFDQMVNQLPADSQPTEISEMQSMSGSSQSANDKANGTRNDGATMDHSFELIRRLSEAEQNCQNVETESGWLKAQLQMTRSLFRKASLELER